MTGTKYDNLFTNDCVVRSEIIGMSMISTRKMEGFGDGNFSMDCFYLTYSKVFGEKPHRHSFAQYMCFLRRTPPTREILTPRWRCTSGTKERNT